MQAGSGQGARPAGPSSTVEKFLNYLLAGDQKPEQAWAGPAGPEELFSWL